MRYFTILRIIQIIYYNGYTKKNRIKQIINKNSATKKNNKKEGKTKQEKVAGSQVGWL